MFWRMFAGAIVGAGATALFLALVEPRMDLDDPANMLAIVAGISYAVIGLAVGLGLIVPRAGARFLNVEDADELREERVKLRTGAIACFLIGLFLLVLALAADKAYLTRDVALFTAAACLAGVAIASLFSGRRSDELTRQITLEASAATFHIALFVLGGWAALAHLGYAGWVSPLALISGLALLELVAIMVVSARKGLMTPR
jgi:hypothetical protein